MPVTSAELREELERALGSPLVALERRPSRYRTSFPLEELEVTLADGEVLRLLLKDVDSGALSEKARRAKPDFLQEPRRELEVYEQILAGRDLGTPRLYGSVADPGRRRFWLFLEHVQGVELYQVGELEVWREVARWLARMHERLASARAPHLLDYDERHLRSFLERARHFTGGDALERVAAGYDGVLGRLLARPLGFIHGELYASNVLVERRDGIVRVCPVDWEMAGVGPQLLDLAALSTGSWADESREAIAQAYYETLARPPALEAFRAELECCRLQIALQWLGWSRDWTPPAEHAHDWLNEALQAAGRLGL